MIDIKITLPSHGENLNFENFYSANDRSEYKFHINSNIKKADMWFVFEDIKDEIEYCKVPKENVVYLNNETSFKKSHFFENHMVKFLKQFNFTYGCYPNLNNNHTNTYPFLPWMIHANHGDSIYKKTNLDYNYFSNFQNKEKQIELSVICSNKRNTSNHELRIEFLNILKNHFKDKLQWYGNGIREIDNKFDVISNSKYHIVLENDSKYNLISEKLYDSYLGLSFPIYYGAPNINDYFDSNSLQLIDINNISRSILKIEQALNNNLYEKNFMNLIKSKNKVLNDYNFYNRILNIVKDISKTKLSGEYIDYLVSSRYCWNHTVSRKKKIKKFLQRKLRIDC